MKKSAALVNAFLNDLIISKNRSPKTKENYRHYLKRFLDFSGDIPPQKITLPLIQGYKLYLSGLKPELTHKTKNFHLIALRAFLKYLAKNDIETLSAEKIELAKVPERIVDFLEVEEIEALFKAATRYPPPAISRSLKPLRDLAILKTLFSTGLRVSELCSLKKKQVNLERREFMVRGKGGKVRLVFLSEEAKEAIKNYLAKRTDNSEYLFVGLTSLSRTKLRGSPRIDISREDKPLTPRSVERLVQFYATKAGIVKKVTPHTLRHSLATDLLRNGADIRSVQALLGHSSITTTQVYTHITNQRLKEVHQRFHKR